MRQAPWILGGATLLGIALGTLSFTLSFPSLIFLSVAFLLLLLYFFPNLHRPFLLMGFVILIATFSYGKAYTNNFKSLKPKTELTNTYRVTLLPEQKDFYQQVVLEPANCLGIFCQQKNILWQAPIHLEVLPGEKLNATCSLQIPENFSPGFDYRLYLAKEGIGYICEEATAYEILAPDRKTKWMQIFYSPKSSVEGALSRSIPEPEAGLAKGLLLGGSTYLSKATKEGFTNVGLTHIVAVSGYNIVIIVNALLAFALLIGLWRKSATMFSFLGIILFIILIGSPASAVRAGIMALAAFGAFLIGRVSYTFLALFLTAALMTLWNPLVLWYDAGFQLSFLATLAVIVSLRTVEGKFSSTTLVKVLQEIVWLSVWVYLFLLPILLTQFQTLTILSIPANIFFLPMVPIAMFSSFLVAIITLLLPEASVIVGWIAYIPLTYIMKGVYFLNLIPGTTLSFSLPLFLGVFWYVLLLFVIINYEKKRVLKQYEKNFTCPHKH